MTPTPDEIRAAYSEWVEGGHPRGFTGGRPGGFTPEAAYLAAAQRFGMTDAEREYLEACYSQTECQRGGWASGNEDVRRQRVRTAYEALRAEREPDHLAEALKIIDQGIEGGDELDERSAIRKHIQAAMEARDGE